MVDAAEDGWARRPGSRETSPCVRLRVFFAVAEKSKIQINLEYWLVRIILGFFGALSIPAAIRLGVFLARLGEYFSK